MHLQLVAEVSEISNKHQASLSQPPCVTNASKPTREANSLSVEEALEEDYQDFWHLPQVKLLASLDQLLAMGTEPVGREQPVT